MSVFVLVLISMFKTCVYVYTIISSRHRSREQVLQKDADNATEKKERKENTQRQIKRIEISWTYEEEQLRKFDPHNVYQGLARLGKLMSHLPDELVRRNDETVDEILGKEATGCGEPRLLTSHRKSFPG